MHTHGTDPSPLGESFYETIYFKQVIKPDGAFLYSRLRRIGAREAVPPDVLSIVGEGCACACTTVLALSRETGLTQKAVRNRLRLLEDEGWFRKIDRSGLPSAFILGDANDLHATRIIRRKTGVIGCGTPTKKGRVGEGDPPPKGQGQEGTPVKKGRVLRGRKKGVRKTKAVKRPTKADFGLCDEDPYQKGQGPSNSIYIDIELDKSKENKSIKHTVRKTPTKKGRAWETKPLDKWVGRTLWGMISDLLLENGLAPKRVYVTEIDQGKLRKIIEKHSIEEVKRVAEFFCERFRDLRRALKWHGGAHPGLFVGYFKTLQAHANGEPIPIRRDCDRGKGDGHSVARWIPFTGETSDEKT